MCKCRTNMDTYEYGNETVSKVLNMKDDLLAAAHWGLSKRRPRRGIGRRRGGCSPFGGVEMGPRKEQSSTPPRGVSLNNFFEQQRHLPVAISQHRTATCGNRFSGRCGIAGELASLVENKKTLPVNGLHLQKEIQSMGRIADIIGGHMSSER